jgi:hypothetical protein
MKTKKIIIGLGLGLGAYLLWKLKSKKSTGAVEVVKETVEPKQPNKTLLHRGVEVSGNESNLDKQFVRINFNVFKTNPVKSPSFSVPQDAQYFIENSKGERRDVIRANKYGLVIDEKIIRGTSEFLPKGATFIVYKEDFK